MRVGVFLDHYQPEDGGGYTFQSEVFEALCRLAGESPHDFVVISGQADLIAEQAEAAGLELLAYSGPGLLEKAGAFLARNWPSLGRSLQRQSSLDRRAGEAGIDFLWFLGPRARQTDLPFMTIVLDLQHRLQPWFPEVSAAGEWAAREHGFARFLPRAAAIIAGTQAGQAEIERFYGIPSERIHVLPHPTPGYALRAESMDGGLLAHYDLPEDFLLYPAQFWPHKNHVNLLLALKQLRAEGLNIPAVFVGADYGNRAHVVAQVHALGLEEQVRILGFVSQAELLALYKQASALSYLTLFGPENLPPLEAFALGLPVIASGVSGAEEQLGDAALLVDPLDPADIAAAIRRLHTDAQLRQQLIARGRQRAQSWTVDDFLRGAFKILDDFEAFRRVWA